MTRPSVPGPRPGARRWVALGGGAVVLVPVVALAVLALAGQLAGAPSGLRDAGSLTRWGVPVVTALRDVAATVTVGLLALAVLTMQSPATVDTDELGPERTRVVRLAAAAAAAWAVAAAVLVLLVFSEVSAVGVGRPGYGSGLGAFVVDVELGRLLGGGAVLAAGVAVASGVVRQFGTAAMVALLAAGALLPVALGGHSAAAADHATAVNTLAAHLVAVAVWVGGLAGLVVLRVGLRVDITVVARRFSPLAATAFAVVAVSGVWRVLAGVDDVDRLLGPYGAIVAAKSGLLLVLGVVGAAHRRTTLRRLAADGTAWSPFLRLVAAELVVMAVAMGLGVALARTPAP